jgi:O-antigen/teichoic acid export membrane protein
MKYKNTLLSLLLVTLSIQGLPIAGQVLIALLVGPATLGEIRWLESVFTILLLATSCGMPSLVFRQSALKEQAGNSFSFTIAALTLTALASFIVLLCGSLIAISGLFPTIPTHYMFLFFMVAAIIPANIIRIFIANAQGAEITNKLHIKISIYSFFSMLILVFATYFFKTTGWVFARLVIELVFAMLIWKLVRQLIMGSFELDIPKFKALSDISAKGFGSNFTFLVRALADNLPILVLYKFSSAHEEVGLYSFASLMIFGPILLISTVMQAELPKLIKAVDSQTIFKKCCKYAARRIFFITFLGIVFILAIGLILKLNDYFIQYSGSVMPLILLSVALPARAFLLLAGGALVARGWFLISSLIALTEILLIIFLFFSGFIKDATSMSQGVIIATWIAVLPGFFLLKMTNKF